MIVVPSLSRYNECATNPNRKKVKEVSDYEKLLFESSQKSVEESTQKQKREELRMNRYNIFSCVMSVLALIVSIIALFK